MAAQFEKVSIGNTMKTLLLVSILLLLFGGRVSSQDRGEYVLSTNEYVPPAPLIGWDSLRSSIGFSQTMSHAGIEGSGSVQLEFDSAGEVTNIRFNDLHEQFRDSISSALRSTHWSPAVFKGKRISTKLSIPFIFYIYDSQKTVSFMIGVRRPELKIMKGH